MKYNLLVFYSITDSHFGVNGLDGSRARGQLRRGFNPAELLKVQKEIDRIKKISTSDAERKRTADKAKEAQRKKDGDLIGYKFIFYLDLFTIFLFPWFAFLPSYFHSGTSCSWDVRHDFVFLLKPVCAYLDMHDLVFLPNPMCAYLDRHDFVFLPKPVCAYLLFAWLPWLQWLVHI